MRFFVYSKNRILISAHDDVCDANAASRRAGRGSYVLREDGVPMSEVSSPMPMFDVDDSPTKVDEGVPWLSGVVMRKRGAA